MEGEKKPSLVLEGVETYKDVVSQLKSQLQSLVDEGFMSEGLSMRLVEEYSYNAFKQSVIISYD